MEIIQVIKTTAALSSAISLELKGIRKDEKLICAEICVRRRPICARDRNELKFCARRNISADFPFHTFKLPSQLDKDLSTVFH